MKDLPKEDRFFSFPSGCVSCSWRFPAALCFAVRTFPVFLSPLEPLTLQVTGEAFHWHRMSEVERQVATLAGRCRGTTRSWDSWWLAPEAAGSVDLADGSREWGSPPVRSVGGRRSRGLALVGSPGSTVTRGGSQAQGAGLRWLGTVVPGHSRGEVLAEDRVGQAESLWVSPRSWGRLQLGTRLSLTCRYSVSGLNTVA